MTKKPKTADELSALADKLAEQAKAARKEAQAAKRREAREAEQRAKEQLARDEIAAFQFSKNMAVNNDGKRISVYDWVMSDWRKSRKPE